MAKQPNQDLYLRYANIMQGKDFRDRSSRSTTKLVETNTTIDSDGVVQSTQSVKSVGKSKEPAFVKLYINDLCLLNNLPSSSTAILMELIKLTTYDNQIVLNAAIRRQIEARLDIKSQTLSNALSRFTKEKILFHLDTGVYMPNPWLYARGDFQDIQKLRMIVEYTPANDSREIVVEVNGKLLKGNEALRAIEQSNMESIGHIGESLDF